MSASTDQRINSINEAGDYRITAFTYNYQHVSNLNGTKIYKLVIRLTLYGVVANCMIITLLKVQTTLMVHIPDKLARNENISL